MEKFLLSEELLHQDWKMKILKKVVGMAFGMKDCGNILVLKDSLRSTMIKSIVTWGVLMYLELP